MTKIVGIVNITPDSFFDGGLHASAAQAIQHAKSLIAAGADVLDIGAEATNPWAHPISWEEEWRRLEPVLPELIQTYPGQISVDSHRPETIKKALSFGPVIINNVTMFRDTAMIRIAAKHQARCIVSHIPSIDIQAAHSEHLIDDIQLVKKQLLEKRKEIIAAGVPPDNIIIDPGIGFGKTMQLNIALLQFANLTPDIPVMIGHSNKRFIAVMSGKDKTDKNANLHAAKIAIQSGAAYLRVHDVQSHASLLTAQ